MKAKAFAKHYVKVSSGSSKIKKVKKPEFIENFTFHELEDALDQIKLEKAPGTDGILAEFITHLNIKAAVILHTSIFQLRTSPWNPCNLAQSYHCTNLKKRETGKRITELHANGKTQRTSTIRKNTRLSTKSISTKQAFIQRIEDNFNDRHIY